MLVVGAGPSGISAAYHLARRGHEVEVPDAGALAGGMMHFGIPAYRLPRDVLDAKSPGLRTWALRCAASTTWMTWKPERREGRFDAVFVAVGAHLCKRIDIPARDAGRILDALALCAASHGESGQ